MTEAEELRIHSELQKLLDLSMLHDALRNQKLRVTVATGLGRQKRPGGYHMFTLTLKGLRHPGRFVEAGRTTL